MNRARKIAQKKAKVLRQKTHSYSDIGFIILDAHIAELEERHEMNLKLKNISDLLEIIVSKMDKQYKALGFNPPEDDGEL